MTTIFLARHGETEFHDGNRYAGSTDVSLTSVGVAQAERLGLWAATRPIAAVYSSDLGRATRTANPAAHALGLSLTIDPRLRELDFGEAEGLTADELERRDPQRWADFVRDPYAHPLPGGERPADAIARFRDALAVVVADHPMEEVLVVAHNTMIRLATLALAGEYPGEYRRRLPAVHPCGGARVVLDGDTMTDLEWIPRFGDLVDPTSEQESHR